MAACVKELFVCRPDSWVQLIKWIRNGFESPPRGTGNPHKKQTRCSGRRRPLPLRCVFACLCKCGICLNQCKSHAGKWHRWRFFLQIWKMQNISVVLADFLKNIKNTRNQWRQVRTFSVKVYQWGWLHVSVLLHSSWLLNSPKKSISVFVFGPCCFGGVSV